MHRPTGPAHEQLTCATGIALWKLTRAYAVAAGIEMSPDKSGHYTDSFVVYADKNIDAETASHRAAIALERATNCQLCIGGILRAQISAEELHANCPNREM